MRHDSFNHHLAQRSYVENSLRSSPLESQRPHKPHRPQSEWQGMVGFVVQGGQAGQSGPPFGRSPSCPPPASIQERLIFRGRGSSCQVGTESRVAMGKKQTAPLGKTEILSGQASFPVSLIRTRQVSFSPFPFVSRIDSLASSCLGSGTRRGGAGSQRGEWAMPGLDPGQFWGPQFPLCVPGGPFSLLGERSRAV